MTPLPPGPGLAGASALTLGRVFPYDPDAAAGTPFSADMVPRGQGAGRFDLPGVTPVWYFAESATHAVAETLQSLRGQMLDAADLLRAGHRLAQVAATVSAAVAADVVDLCDPQVLARRRVRPDHLASRTVTTTRRIAQDLAADGVPGFRWWSALDGDWHATILFHANRPRDGLTFGTPEPLALDTPAVRAACQALAIALAPIRRTGTGRGPGPDTPSSP